MKPYGGRVAPTCRWGCCQERWTLSRTRERVVERDLIDEGMVERVPVPGEDTTDALADGYGCPWCGGDHPGGDNTICEPGYGLNVGHVAPGGDS